MSIKIFSSIISVATFFFISGCSVRQTEFVVLKPAGESGSLVYIYRPQSFSNAIVSPDLIIDGKKATTLSNNSYTYRDLAAGNHTFKLNLSNRYSGNTDYKLETLPSKTYFLKVNTSLKFEKNKPYTRRFDIIQLPPDIALEEISEIPFAEDKINSQKEKDTNNITPEGVSDDQFSINKTRNPFSK